MRKPLESKVSGGALKEKWGFLDYTVLSRHGGAIQQHMHIICLLIDFMSE